MPSSRDTRQVTAGLLIRGDRGLVVRRTPSRATYPRLWDLPGGDVFDDEPPEEALRRVLLEQIGVRGVVGGEPFASIVGSGFRTDMWVVDEWTGDPVVADRTLHDALAWLDPVEMGPLPLSDLRIPALFQAALVPWGPSPRPRSTPVP